MKKILLMIPLMLAVGWRAQGQSKEAVRVGQNTSSSQRIEVSSQKTTHLIFPSEIKSVDRGSEDILAQKTSGVDNVLKLKAGRTSFPETNLTVITADGGFHSFMVNYKASPASLNYHIKSGMSGTKQSLLPVKAVFSETEKNEAVVKSLAAQASVSGRNITGVEDRGYGVTMAVRGLYTGKDMFFYKVLIDNQTNINYDIEALRFYIQDRRRVKRMATQEIQLEPITIIGNNRLIKANREEMLIVVMPKLTIARDKQLVIELNEKGGGRNLRCKMKSSKLLKAVPIYLKARH